MLWKIAWRNLWRNKRRSAVILTSIVVGVTALILTDALNTGMVDQMLYNQVGLEVGHVQIHRKGYHDNPLLETAIENPARVDSVLAVQTEIKAYAPRVISFGLVSSAYSSSGVSIVGIDPQREKEITLIDESVTQGRYLSGGEREILLSEKVAEKLEVELGDKVVAMASRLDGSVGSEVFRVVGLFRTFNSEFDKMTIYIPIRSATRMLGMDQRISEFVILLHDIKTAAQVRDKLQQLLGTEFEVLTYREILPLLVSQVEMMEEFMLIYYVIIGIALIFGIINTMLMVVFERVREIGVLKAIGMPERKIFAMIVLESAILGLLGTGIGILIGYLTYLPLSHSGINLAMFSESLTSFGVGSIIYPTFSARILASTFFWIPLFAVLGAVYPAIKAVRFQPVEAMRFV